MYFYFKPMYTNQPTMSYLEGDIIDEREKSVLIKCIPNGILESVKDTLWIPKKALQVCKSQPDNYDVANWVRFAGKAHKVFSASVFNI